MNSPPTKRLAPFRSVVVAGVALALGSPSTPASSEDGFNPFGEPETSRAPARKADEQVSPEQRPPLVPMDGEPPANARYAPPITQGSGNLGIEGDEPPAGGIDEKGR